MPPRLDRAKLFLSFDALKGFDEIIEKRERVVIPFHELSEDSLYELDWKIKQVEIGQMISITYFDRNEFVLLEGIVVALDLENKKTIQIVDKIIPIVNIVKIEL